MTDAPDELDQFGILAAKVRKLINEAVGPHLNLLSTSFRDGGSLRGSGEP